MMFWVSIAVATLLVTAAIVRPLLTRRVPAQLDESDDLRRRLAVFRDRKREIQRESAAGRLSDGEAAQAQADLLRQLAEDLPDAARAAPVGSAASASRAVPRTIAALLVLLVPLLAGGVYQRVGEPRLAGLDLRSDRPLRASDVDALIAGFEKRTRDNPEDGEAWALLAETRKIQGRHAEAVDAFAQAMRRLAPDARLLADYAESAALLAGGDFSGRPLALLEQALAVDPGELKAIGLMGAAQYRLGNLDRARDYLKQLQRSLPADSEDAIQIVQVLQRIDVQIAHGGAAPSTVAGDAPKADRSASVATTADRAAGDMTGTVSVDAALAARAGQGGTLFVIARQAGGPPIPVAVLREPGAQLPMPFSIGQAQAMDPSRPLAMAGTFTLEARLSRSGNAMRQPGDLYGQVDGVAAGQRNVLITIDRVVAP
ncbi:MAG: c-type cytochrome biogenesis protein CcmI [Burkholderiales bacterium]|nr:c-type cytochrome biogenesis protein CcmI [Burkholderiales bacterium]